MVVRAVWKEMLLGALEEGGMGLWFVSLVSVDWGFEVLVMLVVGGFSCEVCELAVVEAGPRLRWRSLPSCEADGREGDGWCRGMCTGVEEEWDYHYSRHILVTDSDDLILHM